MADAGAMLAVLHGRLLRRACEAAGRHFEGLNVAAHALAREGRIPPALRKKLQAVDTAAAFARHISAPLIEKFYADFEAQLRSAPCTTVATCTTPPRAPSTASPTTPATATASPSAPCAAAPAPASPTTTSCWTCPSCFRANWSTCSRCRGCRRTPARVRRLTVASHEPDSPHSYHAAHSDLQCDDSVHSPTGAKIDHDSADSEYESLPHHADSDVADEEIDDISVSDKEADPLLHVQIERVIDGAPYIGSAKDINIGRPTRDRLYLVMYSEGGVEHVAAADVRRFQLHQLPGVRHAERAPAHMS